MTHPEVIFVLKSMLKRLKGEGRLTITAAQRTLWKESLASALGVLEAAAEAETISEPGVAVEVKAIDVPAAVRESIARNLDHAAPVDWMKRAESE